MKKKLYTLIILVIVTTILFTFSACSRHKNKLYNIEREIYANESVKCVTVRKTKQIR